MNGLGIMYAHSSNVEYTGHLSKPVSNDLFNFKREFFGKTLSLTSHRRVSETADKIRHFVNVTNKKCSKCQDSGATICWRNAVGNFLGKSDFLKIDVKDSDSVSFSKISFINSMNQSADII